MKLHGNWRTANGHKLLQGKFCLYIGKGSSQYKQPGLPKGISLLQIFQIQFEKTLNKALLSTGCSAQSPEISSNQDFPTNHCSYDYLILNGLENV